MDHSTSATMDVANGIVRRRRLGESLPAGPLRALVVQHERLSTREGLARQLEEAYPLTHLWAKEENAWSRWLTRLVMRDSGWVSLARADQVCCSIGIHISAIYPELYEPGEEELEEALELTVEAHALGERDERIIDAWIGGLPRKARQAHDVAS
jgi:hypothetical protein